MAGGPELATEDADPSASWPLARFGVDVPGVADVAAAVEAAVAVLSRPTASTAPDYNRVVGIDIGDIAATGLAPGATTLFLAGPGLRPSRRATEGAPPGAILLGTTARAVLGDRAQARRPSAGAHMITALTWT